MSTVQLVALREELLVPRRQRIDALMELRHVLVLRRECVHAPFGLADRGLQYAQTLIESLELLLLDGELVHVSANRLVQRMPVLLDPRHLARELVLGLRGYVERARRLSCELLHPREVLFCARNLLVALVQLGNLRLHRPYELVQPVGLDHGMVDRVLLALEGLRFVRDMFGKGVERGQALFRAFAQFEKLRERPHALFDIPHSFQGGAAVVARLARHLPDAGVILSEDRAGGADLLELGSQRAGGIERLFEIALSLLELGPQIFERRALLLQRVETGLRLERLR